MSENYTPGYTKTASDFMSRRSAATHADFMLSRLQPNHRLLDCGCGPGSISCDFAEILKEGHVTAFDREASQIEFAKSQAKSRRISNISFDVSSIYAITFPDDTFDVVFAHAIFEHISDNNAAAREIHRVLKPGGVVAIRSPDWGGFILHPTDSALEAAIQTYSEIQTQNGGDVHVGRKLPSVLRNAGFSDIILTAQYDCTQPAPIIAEYLSLKLDGKEAEAMRRWGNAPHAYFAQAWFSAVGTKRG